MSYNINEHNNKLITTLASTCAASNSKNVGSIINISSTPSGGPTGITYTVIILKNDGSGDVTLKNQTTNGTAVTASYTVISSDAGKTIVMKSYSFYTCPDTTIKTSVTEQCSFVIPAAPTTGSISCTTTPSGASVTIDGTLQTGITPITYTGIPTGDHTVLFKLSTYNDCTQYINVSAGLTTNATCTLVPVTTGNLIQNPGFEIGTPIPTNWGFNTQNGITPLLDSTVFHSGAKSVKILVPGTTPLISGGAYSDMIPVKPNTQYTLSGWGMVQGIGSSAPTIVAAEFDSTFNWIANNGIIGFTSTVWNQQSVIFTTNASTTQVNITISIYNGYGTFWADDVSLTEVTTCLNPTVTLTIT